jgi:hypothetical protein
MASDFWSRQLNGPQSQPAQQQPQYRPPARPQRAWWQDDEPEYEQPQPQYQQPYQQQGYNPALQAQMPGQQQLMPGTNTTRDDLVKQLLKVPSSQLNQDQMEFLAEWELETKAKYNTRCPECDSTNFVLSGTRNAHGTFSTDKCFDCGYSARGPLPALGGSSAGKSGSATRQIDTGGGAGPSLYMKIGNGRAIPNTYQPRGS